MYAVEYLRGNGARDPGRGLTIGSYLAYRLRGRQKHWAASYLRAVQRSLERMEAEGLARQGTSALYGQAWYPTEEFYRTFGA